jgi:membrane protease YdiL (CAAX protease family)
MFRTTEARHAAAFTGLVFTMATGIALALPHANIAALLSLFTPVLSVLVITVFGTRRGHRRDLWRGIGLGRTGGRSWPSALVIPMVLPALAYGAAVALGVASFRHPVHGLSPWMSAGANLVVAIVLGTVLILGEEIGWRGFLLPRMQELLPKRRAALVTGVLHGLFHLPIILLTTTYDSEGKRYIVAPIVVVTIALAGVFYAWLRDRSNSIWPVAIAHNAANTMFDLGAASVVTTSPLALAYTAGESGVATLVVVAGLAILLLTRAATWREPESQGTEPRRGGISSRYCQPRRVVPVGGGSSDG